MYVFIYWRHLKWEYQLKIVKSYLWKERNKRMRKTHKMKKRKKEFRAYIQRDFRHIGFLCETLCVMN